MSRSLSTSSGYSCSNCSITPCACIKSECGIESESLPESESEEELEDESDDDESDDESRRFFLRSFCRARHEAYTHWNVGFDLAMDDTREKSTYSDTFACAPAFPFSSPSSPSLRAPFLSCDGAVSFPLHPRTRPETAPCLPPSLFCCVTAGGRVTTRPTRGMQHAGWDLGLRFVALAAVCSDDIF